MKRKPSRKTSKKRNKRNGVQNTPAPDIQNPTSFSHDSYYDYYQENYQVPDHGAIEAENKYLLEQVQWLRGENELLKGEMNSIKISWRKLDVKEDTLKKSLKNSNSARQKEKKKLQNELKVLKESFLAMEKEKDKEILELKQELHQNINQIEVFYKPEMDSIKNENDNLIKNVEEQCEISKKLLEEAEKERSGLQDKTIKLDEVEKEKMKMKTEVDYLKHYIDELKNEKDATSKKVKELEQRCEFLKRIFDESEREKNVIKKEKNGISEWCANLKHNETMLKTHHRNELLDCQAQFQYQKNTQDQYIFVLNQEKSDLQEKLRIVSEANHKHENQLKEQFFVDIQAYRKEHEENQKKIESLDKQLHDKEKESIEYKSRVEELENKFQSVELCYICQSVNS